MEGFYSVHPLPCSDMQCTSFPSKDSDSFALSDIAKTTTGGNSLRIKLSLNFAQLLRKALEIVQKVEAGPNRLVGKTLEKPSTQISVLAGQCVGCVAATKAGICEWCWREKGWISSNPLAGLMRKSVWDEKADICFRNKENKGKEVIGKLRNSEKRVDYNGQKGLVIEPTDKGEMQVVTECVSWPSGAHIPVYMGKWGNCPLTSHTDPILLYIKTLAGKLLTIETEREETVAALKRQIECKEGLKAYQQGLIYSKKLLEDGETLGNYDIPVKSTLHLVAIMRGGMQIFITCPNGKTITLDVEKSYKIEEIRAVIAQKEEFPPNTQQLSFRGQPLEDGKSLEDYGIEQESTLSLVLFNSTMRIELKLPDGSTRGLDIKPSALLLEVKTAIRDFAHIFPEKQILVFAGKRLEDGNSLENCGIGANGTIHCIEKRKGEMRLFVQVSNDRIITVDLDRADTVADLKAKIEANEGTLKEDQRLIYLGQVLKEDQLSLADCGIHKESTIRLVVKLPGSLWIFVTDWSNRIVTLDVETHYTVAFIKSRIQQIVGIPSDSQSLFFADSELENGKTLGDYGIRKGSNLNLVLMSPCTINVSLWENDIITVQVRNTDTVATTKAEIANRRNIPPDLQQLFLNGVELMDARTLASYGVQQNSTLTVKSRERNTSCNLS